MQINHRISYNAIKIYSVSMQLMSRSVLKVSVSEAFSICDGREFQSFTTLFYKVMESYVGVSSFFE